MNEDELDIRGAVDTVLRAAVLGIALGAIVGIISMLAIPEVLGIQPSGWSFIIAMIIGLIVAVVVFLGLVIEWEKN